MLYPDYLEPLESYAEIAALDLTGNFKYTQVSHRDYLGALFITWDQAGKIRRYFGARGRRVYLCLQRRSPLMY